MRLKGFFRVLALHLVLLNGSVAWSSILYVRPGANGDCLSWTAACELQSALSAAAQGDQIWVAAGTYKPTASQDRSIAFAMKSGVAIYGGFPTECSEWTSVPLAWKAIKPDLSFRAVRSACDRAEAVVTLGRDIERQTGIPSIISLFGH